MWLSTGTSKKPDLFSAAIHWHGRDRWEEVFLQPLLVTIVTTGGTGFDDLALRKQK